MDHATDQTIPESEAAERFAELLAQVERTGEPVLIARAGALVLALVPVSSLEELERLRRFRLRAEALERLREHAVDHPESPFGFQTEGEAEEFGRQLGKEVNRAITQRVERERGRESA